MRFWKMLLPICLIVTGCGEKDSSPLGEPPGSSAEAPKNLVQPDVAPESGEAGQKKPDSKPDEPIKVSGEFIFGSNMDEGTFFVFRPDSASRGSYPILPTDGILIRNIDEVSRIMNIPRPEADAGNIYYCNEYSGQTSLTLDDLKQEMLDVYDEEEQEQRTVATLVSMESKEVHSKTCMDLEGEIIERRTSGKGFSSAEEAARLIGYDDPEYGEHDPRLGVYKVGISTTVWLPKPGAHVFVRSCFIGHQGNCVEIYRLSGSEVTRSNILGCDPDKVCVGHSIGGWEEGRLYILEEKTGDKWFFIDGAFRKR